MGDIGASEARERKVKLSDLASMLSLLSTAEKQCTGSSVRSSARTWLRAKEWPLGWKIRRVSYIKCCDGHGASSGVTHLYRPDFCISVSTTNINATKSIWNLN